MLHQIRGGARHKSLLQHDVLEELRRLAAPDGGKHRDEALEHEGVVRVLRLRLLGVVVVKVDVRVEVAEEDAEQAAIAARHQRQHARDRLDKALVAAVSEGIEPREEVSQKRLPLAVNRTNIRIDIHHRGGGGLCERAVNLHWRFAGIGVGATRGCQSARSELLLEQRLDREQQALGDAVQRGAAERLRNDAQQLLRSVHLQHTPPVVLDLAAVLQQLEEQRDALAHAHQRA
mmetsp:Transcript_15979/g.34279  ORF Transcript_15979/g.34279 Transcript_15979/m.34279 type:complete len:232 (-) Transcript_15979:2319-3014(-)